MVDSGTEDDGPAASAISTFDHLCFLLKPYITVKYGAITIPSCGIYFEPQLRQ